MDRPVKGDSIEEENGLGLLSPALLHKECMGWFVKTATEKISVAVWRKGWLAAEAKRSDDLLVAFLGVCFEVVEKFAALGDKFQQSAAG